MKTLNDALAAIAAYDERYRHPNRPRLQPSSTYHLFPHETGAGATDAAWPAKFAHSDNQGVYIILDKDQQVLYVGKASLDNAIGLRLGSYFRGRDVCEVVHTGWTTAPRFVVTVPMPIDSGFEAPGLEEYLIRELQPPSNTIGLRVGDREPAPANS